MRRFSRREVILFGIYTAFFTLLFSHAIIATAPVVSTDYTSEQDTTPEKIVSSSAPREPTTPGRIATPDMA